jgi:hypothetical protein
MEDKIKEELVRGIANTFGGSADLKMAIYDFILAREQSLIHDHEILVNTILEEKNRRIEELESCKRILYGELAQSLEYQDSLHEKIELAELHEKNKKLEQTIKVRKGLES